MSETLFTISDTIKMNERRSNSCIKERDKNIEACNELVVEKSENGMGRDSFEPASQVSDCFIYDKETVIGEAIKEKGFHYYSILNSVSVEIGMYMHDYYAGEVNDEDLINYFEKTCQDVKDEYMKQELIDEDNEEDINELFGHMYEIFAHRNKLAAVRANEKEGAQINKKYNNGDRDFIYYNSDYYYKWESTRSILEETVNKMASDWGVSAIDIEEIEKNTPYTLDGAMNFNGGWNFKACNSKCIGKMIDESMKPPKGFKFFYKRRPYADTGIEKSSSLLSIQLGDLKTVMDVSFRNDKRVYDISELLEVKGADTKQYKEYNEFLKNLNIFTFDYFSKMFYGGYF